MSFGVRRGEFHFLILIALSEKPMHGYALIQEIGSTYQYPVSAGLMYPTLQELQDMSLVVSEEKEGKKIYSLTPEGRKYLEENEETVSRLKAGREYADKMGQLGLMKDLTDIQSMLMANSEYIHEGKMLKIQEVLADAKRKISAIVFS